MSTAIRLETLSTRRKSRRDRPPELRWATENRRRHWTRDVGRMVALGSSDLGALVSVAALLRAVSDYAVLGDGLSGLLSLLIAPGILGGWQFAVACLLALAITGAYGPRHGRRDTGRVLGAVAIAALMVLYPYVWEQPAAAARLAAVIAMFTPGLLLSRAVVEAVIASVVPGVTQSRLVVVSSGSNDWIDPAIFAHRNGGADPRFRVIATVGTNGGSPRRALSELPWVIDGTRADTVLIAGPLTDLDFAFVADTALASGCRLLAAPRTTRIAGVESRAV
jgi:hypothetical protein